MKRRTATATRVFASTSTQFPPIQYQAEKLFEIRRFAVWMGSALRRSMTACVTLPTFLDPFKATWVLIGMSILKRRFMRAYAPDIKSSYGFSLAGHPTESVLNRIILYRGVFEPRLSEVIAKVVEEGDVCVDVGANVGYFTLLFAHQAGESGQVIAIEASPGNLRKLKNNLDSNNYASRVEVFDVACADFSGQSNFYVNKKNDMHCRLKKPQRTEFDYWLMGRDSWRPITVNVMTLPQILGAKATSVTFIKLDIEGAEHLVCQHIIETCSHERLHVALEAKAPHIRETLEPFERAGFFVYDLHNDYRWLLNSKVIPPSEETYASLYARKYMVDVLLCRQKLMA